MRKHLDLFFSFLEQTPFSLKSWITTFASIVILRFLIETVLVQFQDRTLETILLTLTHYFLEFLFVALLFICIARFAGAATIQHAAQFTLAGFLLILTPPIFDFLILHNPGVFSLYEFGSLRELIYHFFSFFDDTPDIGITYGIRIEIALAIAALALYSFVKTKSLSRALMSGGLTYLMLYVVSTLPSWLALLLFGPFQGISTITGSDAVMLFLSPTPIFGMSVSLLNAAHLKMSLVYGLLVPLVIGILLFSFFRSTAITLLKNVRFPQILYHNGLFLLGAMLALNYTNGDYAIDIFHGIALLVMLLAVAFAWLASVVVNDINDQKIDILTNPHRPLPSGALPISLYQTIGILLFLASVILAALVSLQGAVLLIAYQGLAWLYSAKPFRLKRFPGIATGLAACASLLILFAGFILLSPEKNTLALPWQIPTFLFMAYTLLLPIKDFKDILGDQTDRVFTLPVVMGETWAKRYLGSVVFLLFVSSVFFLHIVHLFWLAFFFGTIGYWILQLSNNSSRTFHYRNLAGWIVALVFFYGLFLFISVAGGK